MAEEHTCASNARRPLTDARGIFCCFACEICEGRKRERYRMDVFTDANYDASEPIKAD